MNSLQKITYLALLNILLPYQIVTGLLMWGADQEVMVLLRPDF